MYSKNMILILEVKDKQSFQEDAADVSHMNTICVFVQVLHLLVFTLEFIVVDLL